MLSFCGVTFVLFCFVPTVCVLLRCFCFFPPLFVSLEIYVAFSFFRLFSYHYSIVLSLYGEYIVRFFLPDDVFLPCGHGLDF